LQNGAYAYLKTPRLIAQENAKTIIRDESLANLAALNPKTNPEIFRLLLLYGAPLEIYKIYPNMQRRAQDEADNEKIRKNLSIMLQQPLLQAIVLGDIDQVKALLYSGYSQGHVVTDDDGVSALVYAAAQGHEKILSLLFMLPSYQDDFAGLEQAIEIIKHIIPAVQKAYEKDSKAYSKNVPPPYKEFLKNKMSLTETQLKTFEHIRNGLIKQLKKFHAQQAESLQHWTGNTPVGIQSLPTELAEHIKQYLLSSHLSQ
ncbi:MAG TPA: ankyrin repeat domain-containing protein, partial [Candidatus Babeliaceae bacterium]|nr:ankyrin repeat domain-containing protein [Candidatus Babeliaceae bacterium]